MKYGEILEKLGLNVEKDLEAAKVLDKILTKVNVANLKTSLQNQSVIIFGAGPSLKEDIFRVKKHRLHKLLKTIAADGAVKALLEEEIIPDILVTDLDGDEASIVKANKLGTTTVVHAHGDNIPKIKKFVPKLKNVIGTTQTKETEKLKNFGGFTDGDRAIFLAEKFGAKLIILAGMDFGKEIGEYSGTYTKRKKLKKLKIGKKLIEEIARNSRATILNITKNGEPLQGVPKISVRDLEVLLK